jgi:hypothetical protein
MKSRLQPRPLFGLLSLCTALALAACNLPAPEQEAPDLASTFIAATVAGVQTQGPTAVPPLALPTQAPSVPPPTQAPTEMSTAIPTGTATATPGEGDCDKATFVADVTVPDDTVFDPGDSFTKTWRLRNAGTCAWTSAYALVFVDGRQMKGPDSAPLSGSVNPGQTVDLSVQLVAPNATGTYRGDWMLRNPEGETFGLGSDADRPFFVQIVVGESSEDGGDLPDLGSPDWRDNFDSAANWFEFETDEHKFEIKGGAMVMTALVKPTADYWGLATVPKLTDFYLEIEATTGPSCGGLDRYGVLVRAPDADNGYVYAFSCNGRYRIYRWDGEYTGLKDWTVSSAIKSGPDQTNRMGFWAEGDTFKLYANGELLATVSDDEFAKGRFGLFIGSAETAGFKVSVTRASYWLLD